MITFIRVIIVFLLLGILTEHDTSKTRIFSGCFIVSMAMMIIIYVLEKGLV